MNLLSMALARSVWLCNLIDFNPRGINLYNLILPFLVDTYKFQNFPQFKDLDEVKGIALENGEFKNKAGDILNIKLTLFNFGIVAENRSSTSDTDLFLETLLTQLYDNFKIPHYENIIRARDYLSQLYFSTEKTLEIINPKLKTVSEFLEQNISLCKDSHYELSSLAFWADPVKSTTPLNFVIERQAATQFPEKRYFSSAPLQTEKHIVLLNMMEDILGN